MWICPRIIEICKFLTKRIHKKNAYLTKEISKKHQFHQKILKNMCILSRILETKQILSKNHGKKKKKKLYYAFFAITIQKISEFFSSANFTNYMLKKLWIFSILLWEEKHYCQLLVEKKSIFFFLQPSLFSVS